MNKREFEGVQHLSSLRTAGLGLEMLILALAIDGIADHWIAEVLEMDANLVGAPGCRRASTSVAPRRRSINW